MTLRPAQILDQLTQQQQAFQEFDQQDFAVLEKYRHAWRHLPQQPVSELQAALADVTTFDRGAEPLEILEPGTDWVQRFAMAWSHHEASHAWVRDRLAGVATFAVDGSQIYPSKDLSVPVALVQVGWYENRHQASGDYEKDIRVEILSPKDLQDEHSNEPADRKVNMHRFQMETERLVEYITAHAGDEKCLVFFDGSLVVTFAEVFEQRVRQHYVDCVTRLLAASETHRVPLVAYIDTSYASDLVKMLYQLRGLSGQTLPEATAMRDAVLVKPLLQWGDRTPLFRCRRHGVLSYYPAQLQDRITFTYLKTHDGPPVRLELPAWIYEANRHEQVLDWVRSEVIVGKGYPYAIETADQTAVLKVEDRQLFYRIFQTWAEEVALPLQFSRKMVSKVRRR